MSPLARAADPSDWRLASRSVDWVRVIRQCMRCFTFGLLGIIPVLGTGLAVQALRLYQKVAAELGEQVKVPSGFWYWIGGSVVVGPLDQGIGALGDFFACLLLLGLQSWQLWYRVERHAHAKWHPGRSELVWGAILARAGISSSIWLLMYLAFRVVELSEGT